MCILHGGIRRPGMQFPNGCNRPTCETPEPIINGSAPPHSYGWSNSDPVGTPQISSTYQGGWKCTSTQLKAGWLLTAHHCLVQPDALGNHPMTGGTPVDPYYLSVLTPETQNGNTNWIGGSTAYPPWQVFLHPTLDIALLHISTTFLNHAGQPITNAMYSGNAGDYNGKSVYCQGWGVTSPGGQAGQLLMSANIPVAGTIGYVGSSGVVSYQCPASNPTCLVYFKDETPQTPTISNGDSGGSCFTKAPTYNSDAGPIMSVASAADTSVPAGNCPTTGCKTYEVGVENFRDWVNAVTSTNFSYAEDLATYTAQDPAIASWANGRLDVIARDSSSWQFVDIVYDGSWHAAVPIGGSTTQSPPAAYSYASGHIDVFAQNWDNQLAHVAYANGAWGTWEYLGAYILGTPAVTSDVATGLLHVFARGSDNALWHCVYQNGVCGGWQSLGGVLDSPPTAVSWCSGQFHVFVKGTDKQLWHTWFVNGSWQGWQSLGGTLASPPAVSTWGNSCNRLDVFALQTNGLMQHMANQNLWTQWDPMPFSGYFNASGTSGGPAAVSQTTGRIDLAIRGQNGRTYHVYSPY